MTQSLDLMVAQESATPAGVDDHELRCLSMGWQAAQSAPAVNADAAGNEALSWISTRAPGAAIGGLQPGYERIIVLIPTADHRVPPGAPKALSLRGRVRLFPEGSGT
jgi:hypothetical protein